MTDQIERELAELFHDRAQRLDVLPPRPAAQVRRARLQASLAMASVVAVLAAAGTVGVRLASGSNSGTVSFAGSGSALTQLENVAQRMLGGRWRVTETQRTVKGIGDGSANSAVEVDYDGARKAALVRIGGDVVAMEIDGVAYFTLRLSPDVAQYLPTTARWQRTSESIFGLDPTAAASEVAGFGFGGSLGTLGSGQMGLGPARTTAMEHATVHRTSTGFRIELATFGGGFVRTDVILRSDGSISAVHSLTRVQLPPLPGGAPTTMRTIVTDARFTPLAAPLRVASPDPATVITDAQFQAALRKSFGQGTPGSHPCPGWVVTPSPAVTIQRTAPGGTVTMTQPAPMPPSCRLIPVTPMPRATVTPR